MNKDKEYVVHALLNSLNMLAKEHDVHISSDEDMYLKVDGEVIGCMYYDATEKAYMVRDVAEQEAGNEKPVQYKCYMCPNLVTQETRWLPHHDMSDPINNLVFCSKECAHKALQVFLKNIDESKS